MVDGVTPCKTCFKCGESKPLTDFYQHKKMADGRLNKCKVCAKRDVSEHRHGKGRETVLAYDRRRASEPHRVELRERIFADWLRQHPERRRAHVLLGNAVRAGRVTRPAACSIAGCAKKPEGHHPDYGKPLDVIWLCREHHMQEHARLEREGTAA